MRIVHRKLWPLLGSVLLLIACGSLSGRPDPPTVGAPAPAFDLPLLDGTTLRLAEQRGQVVIVNFWASWCEPCLQETPRLQAWYEQHRARGLQVVGVNTLYRDSRAAVTKFTQEMGVSYPLALDETGTVSTQWLAQQLPRSYVVDRAGIVRFVRIGELTEKDWEQQVLPLLEE